MINITKSEKQNAKLGDWLFVLTALRCAGDIY